jgi:hypothetical protein
MKIRWRVLQVVLFAALLALLPIIGCQLWGVRALHAWSFWLIVVLAVALGQAIGYLQDRSVAQ